MTKASVSAYKYSVGPKTGLPSIQSAIDRIAADLRKRPPVEQDFEVLVNWGTYAGFTIPDNALVPLLTYDKRLIIKANGEYFPVVDGFNSPKGTYIGCDIGSNNPNVTIEGLRFQNFSVGIRASTNSHQLELKRVIAVNNKNSNILVHRCQRPILVNSIIVNGDYGAVFRTCKDITLLHNSVFVTGARGDGNAGLWLQLANDYGGGVSDTGKLTFIGNIVWNTVGPALILFQEDLEDNVVVSDYNDIVKSKDYTIGIARKTFVPGQPVKFREISGLKEWRRLGIRSNPDNSILDTRSISADPKFVASLKDNKGRASLRIDLTLFRGSPVLGLVPSFYIDSLSASLWLPSFFDVNDISTDILQNKRQQDGTAIGANDKRSNAGYFGQDIFLSPRDLNPKKDCDSDPIDDLLDLNLDIVFPNLTPGYFYSHEREYYLYGRKMCRTIGECARTEFLLPGKLSTEKPIKVVAAGKVIKDPRYVDIIENRFVLYHFDLPIMSYEDEVEIHGHLKKWDPNANEFKFFPVHYRLRLKNGDTRFFLPQDYIGTGPVVITDDKISLLDHEDMAHREFSLEFDPDEQKVEIVFGQNSNLLENAQFDNIFGDTGNFPVCWASSGAEVDTGTFFGKYAPVMGDYSLRVSPSGYVAQVVPVSSGEYSVSWHAMFMSGESGVTGMSGSISLEYYDANYDPVGVTYSGSFTGSIDSWERFFATIGNSAPLTGEILSGHYPLAGVANFPYFPENSAYMAVKLENISSGVDMRLDAVQAERAQYPTPYHRKFGLHELTVEYETSTGDFIDLRQAIAPVRNSLSQGFLYIPELPAGIYSGPKDKIVTTLFEFRWPEGRANVMPWARLSGKDKLRHKSVFNPAPEKPKPRIVLVHDTFIPSNITISPEEPTARQGDTQGVGFQIYVTDENGNPYGLGEIVASISEPRGRFPGWLHTRVYGLKQQLLDIIYDRLDNIGASQVIWIPPDSSTVAYAGPPPKPPKSTTRDMISSLEMTYPIHEEVFGAPIILDAKGRRLKTSSDEVIRSTYRPTRSKGVSVIHLRYPPTPGSVKVFANGRYLQETIFDNPDTSQFFVDYLNSQILLRADVSTATVEYRPTWVFTNPANPYRLMFYHNKIFSGISGDIIIGYNAQVTLKVTVLSPNSTDEFTRTFPLVAQNHLIRDSVNPISAEF